VAAKNSGFSGLRGLLNEAREALAATGRKNKLVGFSVGLEPWLRAWPSMSAILLDRCALARAAQVVAAPMCKCEGAIARHDFAAVVGTTKCRGRTRSPRVPAPHGLLAIAQGLSCRSRLTSTTERSGRTRPKAFVNSASSGSGSHCAAGDGSNSPLAASAARDAWRTHLSSSRDGSFAVEICHVSGFS
jgi:hypothetical protein